MKLTPDPSCSKKKEPIHPEDNTGTLYDRLMIKGAELVLETVRAIESNSITPRGQEESKDLKHAPKLFREDCQINWENPSQKVQNFIRGLSPYPGAWIPWKKEQIIKIYKTVITDEKAEGTPGTRKSDNKSYFYVKTEDNWISVLELQLQGKRKMTISEFLRGNEVQ